MIAMKDIARVCHEANRALQIIQNDPTIPVADPWLDCSEEQQASVTNGVEGILIDGNTPEQSHENWVKFKTGHGWVFGPTKDEEKKEHPLLVPYDELPKSQQVKDHLFSAIVHTLGD